MQKMVRFWSDANQLQAQFAMSLLTCINVKPRRGWIRAPETDGADVAQALSSLVEENARLRSEIQAIKEHPSGRSIDEFAALATWVYDQKFETVRRQNSCPTEVTGDVIFRTLSRVIVSGVGWKREVLERTKDQLGMQISDNDFDIFLDELALFGLISPEERKGERVLHITAAGKKVYTKLVGR
jgi:hypothetical protein